MTTLNGDRDIMNVPFVVGICVLLYGPLVSGACNVTLHAQKEPLNFTSPNYPRSYRNDDNCYWDIYPESRGYRVVLEMVYSAIEFSSGCAHDVLTIYVINNGNQNKDDSYRICGVEKWNILIREDQHFHVVFRTDSSGTSSGFLIRYHETNESGTRNCSVPLVATSVGKTFTSPGYPDTHFTRQVCIWTITAVHQNQTILLDTVDSLLQNSSSTGTCDRDSVTVYNGRYGSHQLGTFCGNARPVFNSGGNTLSVRLRTDSSRTYRGFKMMYKAEPVTTCNVALRAGRSPMVLVSPGYPNNYINGLDCQWNINAPAGNIVTVKVFLLDLEKVSTCGADYLLFKDGTANDARQLAKICERTSTPIASSSNHMSIIFHSDSAVTGGGFRMQYSSVTSCGLSDLSATSVSWKNLTSPGYPSHYHNNVNCEWRITAPIGREIKVEIVFLSLEFSSSCLKDYLVFKAGSWSQARQLGKYCGYHTNKQVVSPRNYMTITFHTDVSTTRAGFNLKYKAGISLITTTTTTATATATTTDRTHVLTCGTSKLSANKYSWRYLSSPWYLFSNYKNNMYCEWTIFAPVGYKVKVEIQTIYMQYDSSCSKDYLLFMDGSPSNDTWLGRYCSNYSGYIVSSRNAMTITFRTDRSFTERGFSLKFIAEKTVSECGGGGTISHGTKYIRSPNYPFFYPDNADCEWTITTSLGGYVIHVNVVHFNIEYSAACIHDYVQLYDVSRFINSIGRWCGTDGPNTRTTGQTMKITFHSDSATSLKGFMLSFTSGIPTSGSVASTNTGAILGGVFGGIAAVGIAACLCCGIYFRQKSCPSEQQQRNRSHEGTVSFINVPGYPHTVYTAPTTPIPVSFMSSSPPSYNDVLKDDPPPYCSSVPQSDIQPVLI